MGLLRRLPDRSTLLLIVIVVLLGAGVIVVAIGLPFSTSGYQNCVTHGLSAGSHAGQCQSNPRPSLTTLGGR